jgi:hypothetical protein
MESVLALEVCGTEIVDKVKSIRFGCAARILAAIWHGSLTCGLANIVVLASWTAKAGMESVLALEVCGTEIVHQIEAVCAASTAGILTTIGDCGLTFLVNDVVVTVGTREASVETLVTFEVCSTEIVDQVKSSSSADAAWILATAWERSLALSTACVEILSVSTSEPLVDAASTFEVRRAQIVYQVQSISAASATRILATSGHSVLADSILQVEVLATAGAFETRVESVCAPVVIFAQVVHQVQTVGLPNAARILAPSGDCSLALFSIDIEILSLGSGTSKSSEESA